MATNKVMRHKQRLFQWICTYVAYPLAEWLARLGVMNSRRAWTLLYRVSPGLAGLTAFMDAASSLHNTFYWWWPGQTEECVDFDDLLADVSELIERAVTPGGLDTYRIEIDRLSPLANEQYGVDDEKIGATLHQRKALECRSSKGDRYYDWKRGQGKAAARELLAWACPNSELPVSCTSNGEWRRGSERPAPMAFEVLIEPPVQRRVLCNDYSMSLPRVFF